jgi:hypothetical protein
MAGGQKDERTIVFMRGIMDDLGVANAGELATLLITEGVVTFTESRKVARWVTGENAPNHKMTLTLVELARKRRSVKR